MYDEQNLVDFVFFTEKITKKIIKKFLTQGQIMNI